MCVNYPNWIYTGKPPTSSTSGCLVSSFLCKHKCEKCQNAANPLLQVYQVPDYLIMIKYQDVKTRMQQFYGIITIRKYELAIE